MDKKQCRKYIVPVILTALVCLFLFTRPEICSEGVRSGILLAAETVVPSLFPFMTVASFLLRSGLGEAAGKPFDKVCEKLFRLPGVLAPVIIMSQIGGFPIGAKMTYELLKKNAITENEAQRACLFCINAGPAFVIGTVGSEMLGSVKAGVLLYISTVSASFFTGIFSMALYDKAEEEKGKSEIPFTLCDPVGAFVRSVGDATNDVIKICAWVVIFKTVCDGLSTLPIPPGAALFFEFILEVTNGCRAAAGKAPIPALAAIISFGGLSVHCQIMSYLRYTKLKMRYFYTARAVCASFSAIICMELLKVFPCEVSVFATDSSVTPAAYSVSVPALAALLIMSVLLILEVDSDKKMC